MSLIPHEDVDMFGRTIISSSKDRRINENNDSRRNRFGDDDYKNNEYNNDNYQSIRSSEYLEGSNNDPISFPGNELHHDQPQNRRYNQNRQFRQNPNSNFNTKRSNNYPNDNYNPDNYPQKRSFSGGGYNDRRSFPRTNMDGRFDDYGHNPPPPPPPPRNRMYDKPINRIGPIMSFKSFMQTQNDDLAPEMFQRLYEQYNLKYLQEFSNAFFVSCITEEWFQDRYNPLQIVHMEEEVCQWSAKESAVIKASLLDYPVETINAMCLDPSEAKVTLKKKVLSNKDKEIEDNKDIEVVDATAVVTSSSSNDNTIEKKFLGKHLSGHEDHCVVIYGIHANCSKQVFKSAITEALSKVKTTNTTTESNNQEALIPDRIVVSQPQWSQSGGDRFERIAWIIMPSTVSIKVVQSVLNQLEISVPSPSSFESESTLSFSFTIKASIHRVQSISTKNNYASHYLRVQADTVKALELAYLLDLERKVPEDTRLSTILENDVVQHALVKPTDRLDLSIAYLRRVHFVSFYSGRRFRDEAHLLTYAPSIVYRLKPYLAAPTASLKPPPPPPKELSDNHQEQQQQQELVDDLTNNEPASISDNTVTNEEEDKVLKDNCDLQKDSTDDNFGKKRKLDVTDFEENNMEESGIKDDNEDQDADKKEDDLESGEEIDPDEDKHEDKTSTTVRPPLPLVPKGFKTPNIPLLDSRIENIINDLKSKHDLALARVQDTTIPLPKDEEDAKAIALLNENTFDRCVRDRCILENEGKCRCSYTFCNKLFKSVEFLAKHIKSKHVDFAFEDFAINAEPYMRSRYEAEDLKSRPLPPVEIESQGRKEFKSVKEVLDKYAPQPPPPQPLSHAPINAVHGFKQQNQQQTKHNFQGNNTRDGRDRTNERRWSGGSGGGRRNDNSIRGHDERDRRATIGSALPTSHGNKPTIMAPAVDSYARKITSYIDVDAPKESAVHIDYGVVLLPPPKRRKSLPSKQE